MKVYIDDLRSACEVVTIKETDMTEGYVTGEPAARELTLTVKEVSKSSERYILVVTMITVFLHVVVNGLAMPDSFIGFLVRLFLLMLAYVIGIVLHEGTHVLAMLVFGRVGRRSIRAGHRIREGIIYVHSTRPMTASAYRKVLLSPAILVGIVPTIIGLATGDGWLTAFGWLMTISAAGDVAVWRLIRPLDPNQMVQDHPSEVGVVVV